MAKVFATHTTVTHPETKSSFTFKPGEECPEWAEDLVNNPIAFMQEDVENFTGDFDYHSMTVPQLIELCKTRNVEPESTKKSDLVKALEKNGAGE